MITKAFKCSECPNSFECPIIGTNRVWACMLNFDPLVYSPTVKKMIIPEREKEWYKRLSNFTNEHTQ